MPIKAENRDRYPADWPEIRARILVRAQHRCEECQVPNYVYRLVGTEEWTNNALKLETWLAKDGARVTWIVLTIAHLDHTPENCDPANLRAVCQRCHLRYDSKHHQESAYATRRKGRAAGDLLE